LYVYERLIDSDKERVEKELIRWFSKRTEFPYLVQRPRMTPELLAFYRAGAMARLGMRTGVDGMDWNDALPFSWRHPGLLGQLGAYDFKRFDPATDEAIAYFESRGIRVDATRDMGKKWIEQQRAVHP
jgi:hypothetical protein